MTKPTVRPFLMFQGMASEALDFYVATIPGTEVLAIERYASGEAGPEGAFKLATVSIAGQQVLFFDSPVKHDFSFTPAFSFFLDCGSEEEVRRLASALGAGGADLMPVGNYGFSRLYAWMNDRFGVSWQINCA